MNARKPLPCCHTPTCWINFRLKQSDEFAVDIITRILEQTFNVRFCAENLSRRRYRLKLCENLFQRLSVDVKILMKPASKKLPKKRIGLLQVRMWHKILSQFRIRGEHKKYPIAACNLLQHNG